MSKVEHSISRLLPGNVTFWGTWSLGLIAAYFIALSLCDAPPLQALSLVGTGIALVAMRRLDHLLVLLMISSLVTRGPVNIVGDVTPFDVLVLLVALHVVFRVVHRREHFILSPEAKLMSVLLCLVCFSEVLGFLYLPRHLFLEVSAKPFIQLIEFQVILFAVVLCLDSKEQMERIVRWQIVCAVVFAAIAIYESHRGVVYIGDQSLFGNTEYALRGELKSNPNSLLLIIPAIAFLIYGKWSRPTRLALVAFVLYPFIPQGTRTFYVALCGAVCGMIWLRNTRKPIWIILIALCAIFINSSIVFPKVEEIFRGVHGYFIAPYSAEESSTFGRLILWKTAPKVLLKHPLWGYGVNGYGMELYLDPSVFLTERITFSSWARGMMNPAGKTHNEYLQILLDHGLIAFAIAVYLLFRTWRRCRAKAARQDDEVTTGIYRALFVSFVAFLFAFMSISLLSYHGNNFLQMFFWLNIGLIYAPVGARLVDVSEPGRGEIKRRIDN